MALTIEEYAARDGLGLAELVASGDVTPLEVCEAAISAIEQVNPKINAVVHTMYDRARAQIAAGLPEGPFRGVPLLVKDLIANIAGEPTTGSTALLRNYVPQHDSVLVERFRAAGFTLVAKTNTPELGIMGVTEPALRGPTRNPWDLHRTPGGSSGGSGSAVGARLAPIGHGGDGGGSIRIPSSHCGLFGLKPTRARTTLAPDHGEAWSGYAVQGVLTRSVRDSAACLDAIAGPGPGDPYAAPAPERPFREEVGRDPGKLRIAFHKEALYAGTAHPDCVAAVEDAAALLADLGHDVTEACPHIDRERLVRAYFVVVATGISHEVRSAGRLAGKAPRASDFEKPTWLLHLIGTKTGAVDLAEAREAACEAGRVLAAFHGDYDLFLTATTARPPVRVGELGLSRTDEVLLRVLRTLPAKALLDRALDQLADDALAATPNTQLFNQTGQPAMSVPLYWNAEGLPIGVQLAAPFGGEGTLLRVAAQLEAARPWADRRPGVCAG